MIQTGVYVITDPKRTHYICGKMYAGGNVEVTADMVGDKHLGWLIDTSALIFIGKAVPMPSPAEADSEPPPRTATPPQPPSSGSGKDKNK